MPAARNPVSLSFSWRKVSKEIQLVTGAEVISADRLILYQVGIPSTIVHPSMNLVPYSEWKPI